MSSFWSAWIIVLTLAFLVFIIWLLRWNMSNFTGIKEGELMDHEYDGIVEINNPMPKWWTILFWITIVWGFIYLALYRSEERRVGKECSARYARGRVGRKYE